MIIVPRVKLTPGKDAYTKLLLHMDGADGSTVFRDECGKTVTAYGNAQIDTAQSKFGGASGLFDGTGDYLIVPDSADFDFGTGDFTVDFWGYNLAGPNGAVVQLADGETGSSIGYISGGNLVCYLASISGSFNIAAGASMGAAPGLNWVHYALVRSGSNFYTFRNGVQQSTWSSSASIYMPVGNLNIGRYRALDGTSLFYLSGSIDELRISKGIARPNIVPIAPYY